MSRQSDLNWSPSGGGVVKTTQRVTERMDYDAGTGDVCLDLSAREIDADYPGEYDDGEMD